jgi:hypothetical protein
MRGTLDQGHWVTPFTAHLEIYGLCTGINTGRDLVIAGGLAQFGPMVAIVGFR